MAFNKLQTKHVVRNLLNANLSGTDLGVHEYCTVYAETLQAAPFGVARFFLLEGHAEENLSHVLPEQGRRDAAVGLRTSEVTQLFSLGSQFV